MNRRSPWKSAGVEVRMGEEQEPPRDRGRLYVVLVVIAILLVVAGLEWASRMPDSTRERERIEKARRSTPYADRAAESRRERSSAPEGGRDGR